MSDSMETTEELAQAVVIELHGEPYALEAKNVQEMVRPSTLTPVPCTPEFVLGVMNLRGKIVTIADLSVRLGGSPLDRSYDLRIVMIQHSKTLVGLCVGSILDIVPCPPEKIEENPGHLDPELNAFVQGVFRWNDRLIPYLDLHKILETGRA
jgi:purine-binding chemotaxis protein CheW